MQLNYYNQIMFQVQIIHKSYKNNIILISVTVLPKVASSHAIAESF